jgi:uncharacterized protein
MFIGRTKELSQIKEKMHDQRHAQLIILYGRRRVGKSRLIREAIKSEANILYFEGIEGERQAAQIEHFVSALSRQTRRVKIAAKNWHEALLGLEDTINTGRWVVFIDELPWMASEQSRLVAEFKFFWDRWAQQNPQLVVFLCGSVASFMVRHVVHSKALHNRKTLEICLPPLDPREAGSFVEKKGFKDKAMLYMFFGGIPKYLEQVSPSLSIEKNVNQLCLTRNGFFTNEFETLFKEQFRSTKYYEAIVRNLSRNSQSISEIAKVLGVDRGGGLKNYLTNLVQANFIREYQSFSFTEGQKTKTIRYRLTDPFLNFYFWFIEPNRKMINLNTDRDLYSKIVTPKLPIYLGLQFEKFCEASFLTILEKIDLDLGDVRNFGPFFQQKTAENNGVQIDMVIELRNGNYHFLEFKFTEKPMGLEVVNEMTQKIERLKITCNRTVQKSLVTMNGVTKAVKESEYFDYILSLADFQ